MKPVGRKIVISWGDKVIALEKLVRVKPEDLGLGTSTPTLAKCALPVVYIYDIVDMAGELVPVPVGPAVGQRFGLSVEAYFTDAEYWLTAEERDDLAKEDAKD